MRGDDLDLDDERLIARTGLLGRSVAMQRLRATLLRIARVRGSVLLLGETGTGKELAARALHLLGARATGPFVATNLAAVPEHLAASELFGHLRGSYTGADFTRRGLFQSATGGTLFLDEVGEADLGLQAQLLRAVELGEVRAVGCDLVKKVDLRLVTATNRDLKHEVRTRGFRSDLYWRLAVHTVELPPLRDRVEDVPELLLASARTSSPGCVLTFELEATETLLRHPWPGNVREVRVVAERLLAFGTHFTVTRALLAAVLDREDRPSPKPPRVLPDRGTVEAALAETRGSVQAAAKALGLPRRTFRDHLRTLGLHPAPRG